LKKPIIEWVDPDPAKKIFGCTFLAIILLFVALFHFIFKDWTLWEFYIIPALLLLPMIVQYFVWQRKGEKKLKVTLNPEGFCIGNRWSLFSLNAKGKRKWGKPHFFLWQDIRMITLHDENPKMCVFSWILKPGVPAPDAPQNFFFGRYRSQVDKWWDLNAENALELMVMLMVSKQVEDRRRLLERFRPNA